ncbi:hypothetical protein [Stenotrophomonas pavanii]|nr:hypothetical protein [Stenotrophomonas pavanii]
MPLIDCAECKREISDQASACPGCGAPQRRPVVASSPMKAKTFTPLSGAAIIVAVLVTLLALAFTVRKKPNQQEVVATGMAIIRGQVASDIQVEMEPFSFKAFDDGKHYHVCGKATLNRPGDGPFALNNVTQAVVVSFNRDGRGLAIFNGSDDPAIQAKFRAAFAEKCQTVGGRTVPD